MPKFKLELGEKELIVEIRNLAEQANADVLIRLGDTLVLTTCVMSKEEKEGLDFFPLTVEYEERFYAAGKIRGPRYIRRESRPSDEAICNARLIDRVIRPRFPKDLKREVQVITTVLSWDGENDPDILGIISASLALQISDIPWQDPIGAIRIAKIGKQLILNPVYEERERSQIDLVLAGGEKNGEILINMTEGRFDEVEENEVSETLEFSKEYLRKIINFQREISKEVGMEKIPVKVLERDWELEKEIKEFLGKRVEEALYRQEKMERFDKVSQLRDELLNFIAAKGEPRPNGRGGKYQSQEKTKYAQDFFEKESEKVLQENILKYEKRPDGRKLDEIREIHCEVGILPRTHGSGLFCRGQTKALSILTLGAPTDVQLLEGMEIVGKKRFMHHYNFPPYSVGEIRPLRGPSRRDIGHGMLVERALLPLIPSFEEFPYTMRVVSEILSSNGSTSMASVSSSSLALMDAGVKIKRPAAGISIGLIQDEKGPSESLAKEGKNYKLLTDIQGPEDHHGHMDFKIAGTKKGITAIQMDVKIEGISKEIFKETLERGKKARLQILEKMENVLLKPRSELSPYAPRILTLQINPEKIREVIGPGGRVINEIIEKCEVAIDVQPSGLIFVTSEKEEAAKKAIVWIKNITREIKIDEIFQGKVKRILNFGAFIEILPGQEGLLHISQLGRRVEKVEDILKIGDIVPVKVISIDEQGRINLSLNLRNYGR